MKCKYLKHNNRYFICHAACWFWVYEKILVLSHIKITPIRAQQVFSLAYKENKPKECNQENFAITIFQSHNRIKHPRIQSVSRI